MSTQDYSKITISEGEAREVELIYDSILQKLKGLSGDVDLEIFSKTLADLINFIVEALSSKTTNAILLYTSKIFDKDYIFAHSLNVCIIAIKIGLRLAFDKERIKDLGSLGLLHAREDIGFPEGLSRSMEYDKELDEIIRLADVYDALTHPPAYRHALTSKETLTTIIYTDKFFDRRLIRVMLEELSVYPKGSWVQFCTNEIGIVVDVNKESLLRPTVKISIDCEGKYLEEAKTVDLSKNKLVYILRPLTDEDIERIIKK